MRARRISTLLIMMTLTALPLLAQAGGKAIELTLTDTEATRVGCSMATAEKLGKGYLGIFAREGVIVCMARGPFEDGEDGPA